MGFFSTPFVVLMSELWHFPSCNEIFGLKMAKFSLSRNVALPILPRVIQENSKPHFLRVPATGEGSEKSYPIRASKILGNGTHIWKQEFYIPAIGCGTLIFQLFFHSITVSWTALNLITAWSAIDWGPISLQSLFIKRKIYCSRELSWIF